MPGIGVTENEGSETVSRNFGGFDLGRHGGMEVLGHIAEGLNNAAIAERLTIAEKSVHKHINMIFAKLHLNEETDTHRRVRAVRLWLAAQH